MQQFHLLEHRKPQEFEPTERDIWSRDRRLWAHYPQGQHTRESKCSDTTLAGALPLLTDVMACLKGTVNRLWYKRQSTREQKKNQYDILWSSDTGRVLSTSEYICTHLSTSFLLLSFHNLWTCQGGQPTRASDSPEGIPRLAMAVPATATNKLCGRIDLCKSGHEKYVRENGQPSCLFGPVSVSDIVNLDVFPLNDRTLKNHLDGSLHHISSGVRANLEPLSESAMFACWPFLWPHPHYSIFGLIQYPPKPNRFHCMFCQAKMPTLLEQVAEEMGKQ